MNIWLTGRGRDAEQDKENDDDEYGVETVVVGPSNEELGTERHKSAVSHINRKQRKKAQKNLRDVPRREILGK